MPEPPCSGLILGATLSFSRAFVSGAVFGCSLSVAEFWLGTNLNPQWITKSNQSDKDEGFEQRN